MIIGISFVGYFSYNIVFPNQDNLETEKNSNIEEITKPEHLFRVFIDKNDLIIKNGQLIATKSVFELKEGHDELYDEIGVSKEKQNTVVVIPIFTASAYAEGGFYDYYDNSCDERCLTTPIQTTESLDYSSSANAVKIFELLGYDIISDIEIDKNPMILSNYDKVILLHNEYVTETEFQAIIQHPKVIYLYPNALYAVIEVDYDKNQISLIRGHQYPTSDIDNGFDWKFENTRPYEFDTACSEWEFYDIDNGKMLNCYPELNLVHNKSMLKTIKEF